tara:strand:- start:1087 stop:1662 length:576 start_codon:yes stop_codon:yes gene_type:complete
MIAFKKKYFLIIETIKDIDLRNIKNGYKFVIIYRSKQIKDSLTDIKRFRRNCNLKKIKLYVANNFKLCVLIRGDGIYLSSHNKSFKALNLLKSNFDIIGSAHNLSEISLKIKQGCNYILLSKLFLVNYDKSSSFLGLIKYNKYLKDIYKKLIPLGGINYKNLNKLKIINCDGFALLTEIKKNQNKIINRLF